jgi:hypothetical protein
MERDVPAAEALPVKTVSVANTTPRRITQCERFCIIHGNCRNKTVLKFLFNTSQYHACPLDRQGSIFWPRPTLQFQVYQALRFNAASCMPRKMNATIADRCPGLLSLVFPSSRPLDADITGSNLP